MYHELEKELATLLGWTSIATMDTTTGVFLVGISPTPSCVASEGKPFSNFVPRWTSYNDLAFELMVDHEVEPLFMQRKVACTWRKTEYFDERIRESVKDYKDKAEALRFAIVKAVIAQLKDENEND